MPLFIVRTVYKL